MASMKQLRGPVRFITVTVAARPAAAECIEAQIKAAIGHTTSKEAGRYMKPVTRIGWRRTPPR